MDLLNCYQVLGVVPGVPFEEVKAAYRRLARRYHPDVNPDNEEWASEQFIEVTEAYQLILKLGRSPSAVQAMRQAQQTHTASSSSQPSAASSPRETVRHYKPPVVRANPRLSEMENRLKQQSYNQLQQFLKHQRFPRAIALVEGLAQRITNDPEVHQWQAITYQQWARHLAERQDFQKALIYLKKALKADPHNRRLWTEVKQEFHRIEQAMVLKRCSGS